MADRVGFDQALRDGTTVRIRPIRPDDDDRLLGMWDRTSAESRRLRFHGHYDLTPTTVTRFTDLDPHEEVGLVATLGRGEDERIIGVARFFVEPPGGDHAEFAALVEDEQQGRGIGTVLVRELARLAAERGVATLTGDVLANNSRMLRLIRELGLDHADHRDAQTVTSDLSLDLGEDFLTVVDAADRRAARAALERFFQPSSVAVVGASRDPASIGGMVFHNLVEGGFAGVAYPVNANADVVRSVRAVPSLADLPEVPELVVVCVPAPDVAEVVDEAGRLGVRAVVVVSAGFAELGAGARDDRATAGTTRQAELVEVATSHGMRLVGPNCMGVMNAVGDVRLNATFSRTFPEPGNVGFSSQSGALGLAIVEHVAARGLGLSTFVSVGNKADISGNDLLLYWEEDPHTDVVLLYLESFGNPRKFSRIARRVSRHKPIAVVKSGRTRAGERAASSHTAAVAAGATDRAATALFRQAGIIRTDTMSELFDVATLLAGQPLPDGPRVAVVTNAGGPGTLAADACESNGLEVPVLPDEVRAELAAGLRDDAGTANPVDLVTADPAGYAHALRVLAASGAVDVVLLIVVPTGGTAVADVATAVAEARTSGDGEGSDTLVLLGVVMSADGPPRALVDVGIPSFAFPEDAARALGRVAAYADWRRTPLGTVVVPDGIDGEAARRVVDRALAEADDRGDDAGGAASDPVAGGGRPGHADPGGHWLSQPDAEAVLDAYGVTRPRSRIVSSADEAAATQARWDVPVAVKVAAAIHKTDVGALALDLADPDAVRRAVDEMTTRLDEAGLAEHAGSWLVQEMVEGIEMVVGVDHDPSFGPLVVTGMGGTLVELVRDVSVRITPLTDRDVDEMLDGLRMRPLLDGYRGSAPADVDALRDLLHRIGAMVEDLPEIAELDCNPVFVRPDGQGVVAVDVRIRVTPA